MTENSKDINRFRKLWQRNLLPGANDDSAAIFQQIVAAYAEPQRHYHTMVHIDHCLTMLDQCHHLIGNPDAVELSIWFHDIIYEIGASDNEARSAELYLQLSEHHHPAELRERVNHLIMAPLHLSESIDDKDTQFMVDIDLSSFALPWTEFLRDSEKIRLENPQMSNADYHKKARKFQRSLLRRKQFYLSDFFFQRLETQARQNLADYFEYIGVQS